MLAVETIRPGVQFVPDAAAAFRRADAQVRAEFGRGIGVNSTYRDWDTQLGMWRAWNLYAAGKGPYPGHSKAVHPSESFHVSGLALDSDDWTNERIVFILADNGFIRNRLYVPNENHHFEYIRARDNHYGQPAASGAGGIEDDMTPEQEKKLNETHAMLSQVIDYLGARGGMNTKTPDTIGARIERIEAQTQETRDYLGARGGMNTRTPDSIGAKIDQLVARLPKQS